MRGAMALSLAALPRDNCLNWPGYLDSCGYGKWLGRPAHRVVYEAVVGAVPPGLELDHRCRNRACVNPAHLEPVTHAENMARSSVATKKTCKNGHPFDDANTYNRPRGGRDCRACGVDRTRRYIQRRLARASA